MVFIETRVSDAQKEDARTLTALLSKASAEEPVMWGSSIIGFGSYLPPQRGASAWPLLAFSPRKGSLTIYMTTGREPHTALLNRLGKHKVSGSCLHIKCLNDIDQTVLQELCAAIYEDARRRFGA